jgi:hypothetical protein
MPASQAELTPRVASRKGMPQQDATLNAAITPPRVNSVALASRSGWPLGADSVLGKIIARLLAINPTAFYRL